MKLLLDQGLPRSAAELLRIAGHEALHAAEIGLSTASDSEIVDRARSEDRVVVTLDADFHAQIAVENAASPSVVRIRREGLRAVALVELLERVIRACGDDLERGALVSVAGDAIRIRRLPIGK